MEKKARGMWLLLWCRAMSFQRPSQSHQLLPFTGRGLPQAFCFLCTMVMFLNQEEGNKAPVAFPCLSSLIKSFDTKRLIPGRYHQSLVKCRGHDPQRICPLYSASTLALEIGSTWHATMFETHEGCLRHVKRPEQPDCGGAGAVLSQFPHAHMPLLLPSAFWLSFRAPLFHPTVQLVSQC